MKNFKKVLALVLVVATLLSFATVASAADFKDAKAISNTEAVEVLSAIGVLKGYTDGEFKPTNVITRAEAAKIIAMFDNGDTDIDELYAPVNFTDVENGHWAESFISYCYHTGIIAGVGNNKYAPNDDVTGVQFLKMVLVVLGFDAKEEGLTGTGYAVAARKLALSLGLLNGVGNDFDYTKGLTRENAAQIMLNALTVGTVSYGKVVGYDSNDKVYVIADSKAVLDTEDTLAYAWNLFVRDEKDSFGRPSHTWYFFDGNYPNQTAKPSQAIGTYVDAPVATYTTWVAGCDVYDDLGVTSKDPHFVSYTDGRQGDNEAIEDKASTGTGAQGQLTEIYAIYGENGKINNYVVIHINTYLAKVTKVNAEVKDSKGHVTSARNIELTGYIRNSNNDYKEGTANNTFATTVYTDDFAAGDYVLITGETYWKDTARVFNVATIELAETKTAKLTGVDNVSSVAKLSVAGEKTPVACKYAYEADRTVNDCGQVMNFYFDSYGNVIGTSVYAAPKSYAVLDKLYIDYVKGEAVVYASLVKPTGDKIEDVVVGKITYGNDTMTAWSWIAKGDDEFGIGAGQQFQWAGSKFYHNYFYGVVVNYVENDDSTVDLTVPSVDPVKKVENAVIKSSSKYIWTYVSGKLNDAVIKVSDETEFLYQTGAYLSKNAYEHYTGYTNIPSLTQSTIQYVDANGDGVAEFVYVYNPIKASSTKYVIALGKDATYEDGIYSYTVMALDAEGKLAETVITSTAPLALNVKGLKKVTINNSGLATNVADVSDSVAGVATKLTFGAPTTSDDKIYIATDETIYDLNDATLYNFGTNADLTLATLKNTTAYVVYSGSVIVAVVVG